MAASCASRLSGVQQRHVPGIHKVLAGNGVGEVAVRLLHQQQVAELALVAAKGQRIFIALAFSSAA
jgi:hypothetical protein